MKLFSFFIVFFVFSVHSVFAEMIITPPLAQNEDGTFSNNISPVNNYKVSSSVCKNGGFPSIISGKKGSVITICVEGENFDGNEAIKIQGTLCSIKSIKKLLGGFSQECKIIRNVKKSRISVYDTMYDIEIEIPEEYKYLEVRVE